MDHTLLISYSFPLIHKFHLLAGFYIEAEYFSSQSNHNKLVLIRMVGATLPFKTGLLLEFNAYVFDRQLDLLGCLIPIRAERMGEWNER